MSSASRLSVCVCVAVLSFPIKHPACQSLCKQVHQEHMYQEYSLSRAEAQLKQMEKVLTQQNQCRELELTAMKGEIASLKKVNDNPEIPLQIHNLRFKVKP